jgi:autophagy-related protein 9
MRKDNYFIALLHEEVLTFSFPIFPTPLRQLWRKLTRTPASSAASQAGCDGEPSVVIFGKTLIWNLKYCLIDSLFRRDGQLQADLEDLKHPRIAAENACPRVQKLIKGMALVNLLAMPFLLVFMGVMFFLKHGEELQSKKAQASTKQYTRLAEWTFREYNELPHLLNTRLAKSHELAQRCVDISLNV